MLLVLRFALCIGVAAFFTAPITAKGQHARVYVSLMLSEPNPQDALQNRAITFTPVSGKHIFIARLLSDITSGALATFTDTACVQALPAAEARQRLQAFLSGSPCLVSANAVLNLYANDSTSRSDVSHVRVTVTDGTSPELQQSFICKSEDVLPRIMRDAPRNSGYFVPSLKRSRTERSYAYSYRIDRIEPLTEQTQLLKELALNQIPELLFQAPAEQILLVESAAPTAKVWLTIPRALTTANSLPDYPKGLPERMLHNQALFYSIVPHLLKQVLTGKIKVNFPSQCEILPIVSLHQTVANHPRVKALGRMDKKLAQKKT